MTAQATLSPRRQAKVDRVLRRHSAAVTKLTVKAGRKLRRLGVDDLAAVDGKIVVTAGPVTPEDITAAIDGQWDAAMGSLGNDDDPLRQALRGVIRGMAFPIIESATQTLEGGDGLWEAVSDAPEGVLWHDLRPSEATRLVELMRAAVDRAEAICREAIADELITAGAAFAREYPDLRLRSQPWMPEEPAEGGPA